MKKLAASSLKILSSDQFLFSTSLLNYNFKFIVHIYVFEVQTCFVWAVSVWGFTASKKLQKHTVYTYRHRHSTILFMPVMERTNFMPDLTGPVLFA